MSSNAKGPGLLDGDFLLEGTSLGIAENMPRLWLKLLLLLKKFVIHSPRCVNRWDLCVSMCLWGWNRRAKMCMLDLLIFTHPWDF